MKIAVILFRVKTRTGENKRNPEETNLSVGRRLIVALVESKSVQDKSAMLDIHIVGQIASCSYQQLR